MKATNQTSELGLPKLRIGVPKKGRSAQIVREIMEEFLKEFETLGYGRDMIELVPIRMEDVPSDFGFGSNFAYRRDMQIKNRIDLSFYPIDLLQETKYKASRNIPKPVALEAIENTKTNIGSCSLALLTKPETDFADIKTVATTFPTVAAEYFKKRNPGKTLPVILYREGGCEAVVAEGIADCAIDVVETGSTAKSFGLQISDIGIGSQFVLVTRNDFGIAETGSLSVRKYIDFVGQQIARTSQEYLKAKSLRPVDAKTLSTSLFQLSETVWERLLNPREGSQVTKLTERKTIIGKLIEEVGELDPQVLELSNDKATLQLSEICDVSFMAVAQALYVRNLGVQQGLDLPQLFTEANLARSTGSVLIQSGANVYEDLMEAAQYQTRLVASFKSAIQLIEGKPIEECGEALDLIKGKYAELQTACMETVSSIRNYLIVEGVNVSKMPIIINGTTPVTSVSVVR